MDGSCQPPTTNPDDDELSAITSGNENLKFSNRESMISAAGATRGDRSEGLGSADCAGQRGTHQEGDLRLDTGVHVVGERHGAAVSDTHRVGQAAPDHLVDADLGHLRTRGEAHLDADQPLTALPAAADRLRLDGVRVGDTEIDGVGELSDRGGRAGRLVGPFGEFAE